MKKEVLKQHVGIDISKDDFRVNFQQLLSDGRRKIKGSRKFNNNLSGYKSFIKWVKDKMDKAVELSFSMEGTGIYHENLAYYLYERGYQVSVLLANVVKAYAKSLNINTKTDKVDAKTIAQMGIERNLRPWRPVSAQMRVLKQLTRERGRALKYKTSLRNQMHALEHGYSPNKKVLGLMRRRMRFIEKQIADLDKTIALTIEKDAFLNERVQKICQVRGLRITTVATIIAETNGFQQFSSQGQLVSYAGYDVVENQSGTSVRGKTRISKRGNARIRAALFFSSLSAKKHEPSFRSLFDRVYERSGIKMKGVVAVQRKLLLLIYTLFKKNVDFDPDYYKKHSQVIQNKSRQSTRSAYAG